MTTTVTIKACCSSDKHVEVTINDLDNLGHPEISILQDQESSDYVVYDNRAIVVKEVLNKADALGTDEG
jgi:hypothetical protein